MAWIVTRPDNGRGVLAPHVCVRVRVRVCVFGAQTLVLSHRPSTVERRASSVERRASVLSRARSFVVES